MEPHGRFLEYSMESLVSILKAPLGQTLGQKPSGPAAPRVFGLGSGLGGPSIYSLGTPLRTLGNLPRGSIHHYTPSAFPQIVILSRSRRNQVKQNKQTNNIKKTANGGP